MTAQHSIRDDTAREARSPAEPGLNDLTRLAENHVMRIEALRFAWHNNLAECIGGDREADGNVEVFVDIALDTIRRDARELSEKALEEWRKSLPTAVMMDRGGEYRVPGPVTRAPDNGWGRAVTRVVQSGAVELDGDAYTASELQSPELEGASLDIRLPFSAEWDERAPGVFLPDGRFIRLEKKRTGPEKVEG